MALALRVMMRDLGEPYEWQEHDAKTPKFEAAAHDLGRTG